MISKDLVATIYFGDTIFHHLENQTSLMAPGEKCQKNLICDSYREDNSHQFTNSS